VRRYRIRNVPLMPETLKKGSAWVGAEQIRYDGKSKDGLMDQVPPCRADNFSALRLGDARRSRRADELLQALARMIILVGCKIAGIFQTRARDPRQRPIVQIRTNQLSTPSDESAQRVSHDASLTNLRGR